MRTKQFKKLAETTRDRHLAWISHYVTNDFGIWIECTSCKKWRKNYEYSESHEVPENWICSMGILDNGKKGSCEEKEENTEELFLEYSPGSVVWARLDGYPWWPGMVDEDPDIEEYFWCNKRGGYFYNVTFLDANVTHAWIPATCMSSYLKPPHRNSCLQKQYKKNKYSDAIMKAENRAREALNMTIKERLQKFSFAYLYKGKWPLADNFEDDEEEDNPLDVTDVLLQEIDDLDSLDSLDADDHQSDKKVAMNLDFLPSEKKIIQNEFDYLKKKNKVEQLNLKKNSFNIDKYNEPSEYGIIKSNKNIQVKKSSIKSSKNASNSFTAKEKKLTKRSKNSSLPSKKFKTEKKSIKSNVDEVPLLKIPYVPSKKYELIDISDREDFEESAPIFNINNNIPKENALSKKNTSEENLPSNEVNSITTECDTSNKCTLSSPLKDKDANDTVIEPGTQDLKDPECDTSNKSTLSSPLKGKHANDTVIEPGTQDLKDPECDTSNKSTLSSPLKDEDANDTVIIETGTQDLKGFNIPIEESEQEVPQFSDFKSSESIPKDSQNITENKIPPLQDASAAVKVNTFISHLDKCIDNVINNANVDIESLFLSLTTKKGKQNKNKGHTLGNSSSKDNKISSGISKLSKENDTSISKDSKQDKGKNTGIIPAKKSSKLVGYDKFTSNKVIIKDNGKNFDYEKKKDSEVMEKKSNKGQVDNKENNSSKTHCSIASTGNKIKPDFKTFKRPFKNTNISLQNDVMNKKQHTEEEKCNSETSSLQLSNVQETNLDLNEEKSFSGEFFAKFKMENDENSIKAKTLDEMYEIKENNFEVVTIDEDNDKDSKYKNEKEDNDCFFSISLSDEE